MPTKAELISQLKVKGVRGKLSKMTKPQLQKLHREHSDTSTSRGHLELEPLPEERTSKPSVARKRSNYQEFVAQHLKENGGNMQAAAAAYREQQGSGLAGNIGRKVGKAVTHGAVGVARGVRDAVKDELHHKKEHKGGSMSDHAKHHSDKHMDVMERKMDKGVSFDDAHEAAMSTVGAGYDSDDDLGNYLEGGAYWADRDFSMSMEPELQGSGDWYNPFSWSSGTQQAVGTALQTAGMMGLMALGGPEAEAVMGAEEGVGAESLGSKGMTTAEKDAFETKYLDDSPMNPDYKPPTGPKLPVRDIDEFVTSTSSSGSSASSGSEGLLRTSMNPTALKQSEVAGETVADDTAATSEKTPLFDTPEPASDEALEGTEEDAAPERIKKNVSKMRRLVNEGKTGAARKIRKGLVDKYGLGVDIKVGETWGQYFKRVSRVVLSSVAIESGEQLKTEGEQKESFTKIEDEGRIVTNALKKATEGLGTNQANIMQELQRERQRNLASEWQRARDRTYNPYLQ